MHPSIAKVDMTHFDDALRLEHGIGLHDLVPTLGLDLFGPLEEQLYHFVLNMLRSRVGQVLGRDH